MLLMSTCRLYTRRRHSGTFFVTIFSRTPTQHTHIGPAILHRGPTLSSSAESRTDSCRRVANLRCLDGRGTTWSIQRSVSRQASLLSSIHLYRSLCPSNIGVESGHCVYRTVVLSTPQCCQCSHLYRPIGPSHSEFSAFAGKIRQVRKLTKIGRGDGQRKRELPPDVPLLPLR